MAKQTADKMQGTIEKKARNEKAILIDDVWYSAFKAAQMNGAEEGDYVEFEYESVVKGAQTFHNIKGNVTVKGASKTPPTKAATAEAGGEDVVAASQARYATKERNIVRQNMLSHATAIVLALNPGDLDSTIEDVISTARRLEEEYINAE